MNLPKWSELQPIETYWGLIKRNLKKTEHQAKHESDLKIKRYLALNKINNNTVYNIMPNVKRNIGA